LSESIEEYLEAIYAFNEKGETAKNADLAERLKVSPPSVTQMTRKLAEEGLVTYEPYRGVTLTGSGTARAQKVVRKHRLLERFLHDTLGLDKGKVHDEACRLEHNLSDEAAAALCSSLNNPASCPDDGRPIPPCTLDHEDCGQCKMLREGAEPRLLTQLSNLKPSEEATVAFVRGGRAACQRIVDMGLCPGTRVRVVNAAPFHGPIEVSVRDTVLALGRGLAAQVYVELEDKETPAFQPHGPRHTVG